MSASIGYPRRHPRLIAFIGLTAMATIFAGSAFAGSSAPAGNDAAGQANSVRSGEQPSVRLLGAQMLFAIDAPTGQITRAWRAQIGSAVYRASSDPQAFGDREFIQLLSGPFADWWVETTDSTRQVASQQLTDRQLELAAGRQIGIRFYAGGTVRLRQPVLLPGSAKYNVSSRTTVDGRTFYLVTDGPLADRWVSLRRAQLVASPQPILLPTPPVSSPTAGPTADPTAKPTSAPTTPPTPEPTVAPPTPAPGATPAATWKGIVLLYTSTDVTYTRSDGTDYHLTATMSTDMHDLVLDTVGRFERSVGTWSNDLVHLNLDIVEVPHPITALDSLSGGIYWVGPDSIKADMNRYAPVGSYDSIFVVWQARDAHEIIPVGGWGLTLPPGSWANGAGFSSVIAPSDMWWWTNAVAPGEVFVHEWLHQVVYWNEAHDRLDLNLHAGPDYGYQSENGSWRRWLSDVMTGNIWDTDHYTGVSRDMWAADQPTQP